MNLLDRVRSGLFYMDGGTGSYLQGKGLKPGELPELWNLQRPNVITELAVSYYEAGSHMVCTNTFGANRLKFNGENGMPTVSEVVNAAYQCASAARECAEGGQTDRYIALDIGPLGKMLEPLGDLSFEDAVDIFGEVVRAGVEVGVDCTLSPTIL